MLHELMGGRASIALLVNPTNPYTESETRVVQATAGALGLQLRVLNATSERDLATVFAAIAEMRRGALLVGADQKPAGAGTRTLRWTRHHVATEPRADLSGRGTMEACYASLAATGR